MEKTEKDIKKMSTKKTAILFVILAATMWGTLGVTVKVLSGFGLSPIQMVVVRLFTSVILLGGYLMISDKSKLRIDKRDIKWFIGTGIFSMLFFNTCYCTAVQLTSLSIAAVLLYTSPIFVTLLSIPIFKENLTIRKLTAMIFSVIGCMLVSGVLSNTAADVSIKGLMFGICAAIGYAIYGILARILVKKYHTFTILFYTFLLASIGGFFVSDVHGIVGIVSNKPVSILVIILAALICNVIPYILFTTALKYIEASRVSIIASVEPVVATVIGIVAFGETLTFVSVIGIVCVLFAIGILSKES